MGLTIKSIFSIIYKKLNLRSVKGETRNMALGKVKWFNDQKGK